MIRTENSEMRFWRGMSMERAKCYESSVEQVLRLTLYPTNKIVNSLYGRQTNDTCNA